MTGGRLAFTGLIHRAGTSDQALMSSEEMADGVSALGCRAVCAKDIPEMDPQTREQLRALGYIE